MGSQDSIELAQQFLDRHQVNTPLMTWDSSFETWRYYQVRGQPTVILVDPQGTPIGQWFGLTQEAADLVESYGT
ncbi:MAG: hypothetical protein AAF547_19275 [Actinomycetota bacterium]